MAITCLRFRKRCRIILQKGGLIKGGGWLQVKQTLRRHIPLAVDGS
jgi:hypothetical protein